MSTGSTPPEQVQILDEDGQVRADAAVPDIDDETLIKMYEGMRFARHLDERAISLHRQGRMGTYPPLAGQEAAQVAATYAFSDDDWLLYQYREHGVPIVRGLSYEYLLYWMGHEEGNEWLADRHVLPINISIASHLPHATGMAWAAKLNDDDDCVVGCHFGDGASSEGDFHEALNFAGVFDVPAVFFCNNNQWAISVPTERQTASATFAQKARAYGFRGVRVDGMDPLAVYQVTREAVERARTGTAGEGAPENPMGRATRPTLIEPVMYRLGAHTTVDDPTVYRDEDELERWEEKDPIPRMETFLRDQGLLDDGRIESIEEDIEAAVGLLIDRAEEFEPEPGAMFEHTYAEQTPRVAEGQAELAALRQRHGDDRLTRDE